VIGRRVAFDEATATDDAGAVVAHSTLSYVRAV
jgi:hypothetical protein